MKIHNLETFTKGWVIGDFEPSFLRTKDYELGIKRYKKGEKEQKHVHKIIREYTCVVHGKVQMNNRIFEENDIIEIEPNEPCEFLCLEDAMTIIIKTPSIPSDKYVLV